MSTAIPLGPSLTGTLVAADLDSTVAAYCDYLYARVLEDSVISAAQAALWGTPGLSGSRLVTLQSATGQPWLRVLANPDAAPARPFLEQGWLALEVLVSDVDALAERLGAPFSSAAAMSSSTPPSLPAPSRSSPPLSATSPFVIYRPPANLDVSDKLRAMQVIGPAGEVLYLTQVTGAVPPFDLPVSQCEVERLFIAVSACRQREEALAVYRQLGAGQSWCFDTRLSSVNRAQGLDLSQRHPVAAVQLAGQSLVEIDQLKLAGPRPPAQGKLPAGIAVVSFVCENIDSIALPLIAPPQALAGKFYRGRRVATCRGAAGELIELIEGEC